MAIIDSILKGAVKLGNRIPKRTNYYVQQTKVLKKLMTKAEHTAFGEHFHFTKLLQQKNPIEGFQANVKMYDYSSGIELIKASRMCVGQIILNISL